MNIYKIELMVVDFDGLGADAVKETIECQKYPNYCIAPSVQSIEAREVDWSDEHPLNKLDTSASAFKALFSEGT